MMISDEDDGSSVYESLVSILDHSQLNEYGFIISKDNNYINYIEEQGKLAISYKALVPVFRYAQLLFRQSRLDYDSTRVLLIVNADHYTAWNARKHLILAQQVSLQQELAFVDLIMSKHVKSGETWAHRRWILEKIMNENNDEVLDLQHELDISYRCAELYPNNYYAWTHRTWVILEKLLPLQELQIQHQIELIHQWTSVNVSQHAGFAHLQAVLSKTASQQMLIEELDYVVNLIQRYPEHETLWLHRRFVALHLDHVPEDEFSYQLNEEASARTKVFSQSYKLWLLKRKSDDFMKYSGVEEYNSIRSQLVELSPFQSNCWKYFTAQ